MRLRPSIPVLASTLLAISACDEVSEPNLAIEDPIQMGDGGPDGSVEPVDSGRQEDAGDASPTDAMCPADACTPGGKCVANGENYACECPLGYAGTGTQSCTDVNECLSAPCGQGECTNLAGSYACDCSDGYRFDGTTCIDIDECAESASACGGGATCSNQPGGFLCDGCPAGSKPADGPFSACVDIDECAVNPSICGNGGTCANAAPGYTCSACNVGFASDGSSYPKCIDVNECALGTDTCADDKPCSNTAGSFVCACLENTRTLGTTCMPVLSALEVSAGTLTPAFEGETTSYTLTLPPGVARYDLTPRVAAPGNESIEIDGQAVTSGAAVTIDAPLLSSVATSVEISVADETTTYVVEAHRTPVSLVGAPEARGATAGRAVAISGDGNTMVMGAPGVHISNPDAAADNSGAAYVFVRGPNGWQQDAMLRPASGLDSGDLFGAALAISGDGATIAVGAYAEDSAASGVNGNREDDAASSAGAVYVFTRTTGGWEEQAYVKATNPDAGDNFGWSVALDDSGNTLAVGARREDSDATEINGSDGNAADPANYGAVYVYTRTASIWNPSAYVKAPNAGPGDSFGWATALSGNGDTLLVGAVGEGSNAAGVLTNRNDPALADDTLPISGAAYIFKHSANGWAFAAALKATSPVASSLFGAAATISADGSTFAVATKPATGPGDVHVFVDQQGTVTHQQLLTSTAQTFGAALALSGDGNLLLVGAPGEDGSGTGLNPPVDTNATDTGAGFLYRRGVSTWGAPSYLKGAPSSPSGALGFSVMVSADATAIALGTPGVSGAKPGSGAVYVY